MRVLSLKRRENGRKQLMNTRNKKYEGRKEAGKVSQGIK